MTRCAYFVLAFLYGLVLPKTSWADSETKSEDSTFESSFENAKKNIQRIGQETVETIDVDENGFPEIRKIYSKRDDKLVLIRKEIDLNNDGKFDVVRTFKDGQLDQVILDFDYDGKADTISYYRPNEKTLKPELVKREFDLQVDGKIGVRKYFVNNEIYKKEMDRNGDGTFDRFDFYKGSQLSRVEFDENDDGIVDRWGLSQSKNRFPYIKEADEKKIQNTLAKSPSLLDRVQRKPAELPVRKLVPKKKKTPRTMPRINQAK